MQGEDEIDCLGFFKAFTSNTYFRLKDATDENIAYALSFLSWRIDEQAFIFSEIKTKQIEDIIKLNGSGLEAVIGFLSSIKPGILKESLIAASSKELLPAAESYLFFKLLQKAKVEAKLNPDQFDKIPVTEREVNKEESSSGFRFIAKYKNWISIKKLSLDKNTKDWEVSGLLSGVNNTIVNKVFEFSGLDKTKLDPIVTKVASGKRRSYGNVVDALKSLVLTNNPKENAYLVCKTLETLGYKPYSSPEMLTGAHPEIKPPKVKGRKPKG